MDAFDPDVGQRQVVAEVGHGSVFFDTEMRGSSPHLPWRARGGKIGVDPNGDRCVTAQLARQDRQLAQFALRLDHDGEHPHFQRPTMFFRLFVGAQQNDVLGRNTSFQGNFQLRQRTDLGIATVRADQFDQRQVRVDLQRIEDVHTLGQRIAQLVETAA
ncbi:hypothetical protein D3C80_1237850 [compost metagenome]